MLIISIRINIDHFLFALFFIFVCWFIFLIQILEWWFVLYICYIFLKDAYWHWFFDLSVVLILNISIMRKDPMWNFMWNLVVKKTYSSWCDTKHNPTKHNPTKHNPTQYHNNQWCQAFLLQCYKTAPFSFFCSVVFWIGHNCISIFFCSLYRTLWFHWLLL